MSSIMTTLPEAEQLEFLVDRNFAAESVQKVLPILREYVVAHQSE